MWGMIQSLYHPNAGNRKALPYEAGLFCSALYL